MNCMIGGRVIPNVAEVKGRRGWDSRHHVITSKDSPGKKLPPAPNKFKARHGGSVLYF